MGQRSVPISWDWIDFEALTRAYPKCKYWQYLKRSKKDAILIKIGEKAHLNSQKFIFLWSWHKFKDHLSVPYARFRCPRSRSWSRHWWLGPDLTQNDLKKFQAPKLTLFTNTYVNSCINSCIVFDAFLYPIL